MQKLKGLLKVVVPMAIQLSEAQGTQPTTENKLEDELLGLLIKLII